MRVPKGTETRCHDLRSPQKPRCLGWCTAASPPHRFQLWRLLRRRQTPCAKDQMQLAQQLLLRRPTTLFAPWPFECPAVPPTSLDATRTTYRLGTCHLKSPVPAHRTRARIGSGTATYSWWSCASRLAASTASWLGPPAVWMRCAPCIASRKLTSPASVYTT